MDYEYKIPAAGPIVLDDAVEQQAADAASWALMGADDISRLRLAFFAWVKNVIQQLANQPASAAVLERRRKRALNIERAALGLYAITPEPVDQFDVDALRWTYFFRLHGATIEQQDAAAQLVHAMVGARGI